MAHFLVLVELDPKNSDSTLANQLLLQMGLMRHFRDEHGVVRAIAGGGYGVIGDGNVVGLREYILHGLFNARHWVSNIIVAQIGPTATGQHGQKPGPMPLTAGAGLNHDDVGFADFVDWDGQPRTTVW